MVCEDDIRFCNDANARIARYMTEIPGDWDIAHFQSLRPVGCGEKWDDMRQRVSRHVYRGYNEGAGASCYALTRRCMEFLLQFAYPISKAPDGLTNWPTGWWPECEPYAGYVFDPLPCESGVFESDIGDRGVDVPEILYRRWLDRVRKGRAGES
jgi:GR25 family glycosyltransferase involved in LPS biosynthesis